MPRRERSTFLQRWRKGHGNSANEWLLLISTGLGGAVGIYDLNPFTGILAACASLIALSVLYAGLARLFGWPWLSWKEFLCDVFEFFTG